MFFPRAPRPLLSTKPNVVQIVSQKQRGAVDPHLLIIEKKPAAAEARPVAAAASGAPQAATGAGK